MTNLVNYVPCTDVEASIKWYSEALGFKLDSTIHAPGLFAHIYLDGPDARSSHAQLMLRNYPRPDRDGTAVAGSKPAPYDMFFDVTAKAKGKEAVDEKYKAIKATGVEAGLKAEPKDEDGGYRSFELTDPDGHRIAFYCWV